MRILVTRSLTTPSRAAVALRRLCLVVSGSDGQDGKVQRNEPPDGAIWQRQLVVGVDAVHSGLTQNSLVRLG
jgi:hypothetical protein